MFLLEIAVSPDALKPQVPPAWKITFFSKVGICIDDLTPVNFVIKDADFALNKDFVINVDSFALVQFVRPVTLNAMFYFFKL
jgi:hypothetical protein